MRICSRTVAAIMASIFASSAALANCPGNPKAIGVSRTVEIDTTGSPRFGFEHYKVHDFLAKGEVVFTFDDGPLPTHTRTVLKALANHCTKATFFPVGKLALGYPEVLREIIAQGHTVGGHTWSHKRLSKGGQPAIDEIEKGFSAIVRGAGKPTTPFFRYPFLRHSEDTLAHLAKRNISVFSTDVDSFDFRYRPKNGGTMITKLMARLEKNGGKGIILMHDIQPVTASALPALLDTLKAKGYRVVHLTSRAHVTTLPEYDKQIEKDVKGLPAPGNERPTASVVRTVPAVQ
ncbi:MAG: hypothetical protein RLZ98_2409 [Pseudomonadota bacterium]|jgi:peptidoglycan/xylan/chitin deacetylase (PgdA/CDA1 family)